MARASAGMGSSPAPIQYPEEPGSTPEDASRGGRIRTYDFLLPKQARYQAALHPDDPKGVTVR